DRLLEMPNQLREQLRNIGPHLDLSMLRTELRRDDARIRQLVVVACCPSAAITDTVGIERPCRMLGHQHRHSARINATGKKRTERHVANHMRLDSALKLAPNTVRPFPRIERRISTVRRRPVAF